MSAPAPRRPAAPGPAHDHHPRAAAHLDVSGAPLRDHLILLDHPADDLTLHHWRYLHERTSGYIGSLAMLFKEAAHTAMDTGVEALTRDIMDSVVFGHDDEVDYAKTKSRRQAAARRRTKKAPPASGQDASTG
ncbi:hypothetical protein [Nonomuraea fuscirosea]|nr:hypothetical protein [Nonomuraea fuscirosea]